jgi:hypothetical protein
MAGQRPPERQPERQSAPACRWRTSAETLDLIEALERIEALLVRIDERTRHPEGTSSARSPSARDGETGGAR